MTEAKYSKAILEYLNNIIIRTKYLEYLIVEDTELISSGILDSLSLVQLISFIEEKFKISIDDWEVTPDNFRTVNKIVSIVEAATHAKLNLDSITN